MSGSIEYAFARIAARQSRRPDALAWHRVETARALDAFLDAARGGAFDPWLAGLDARAGLHAIEAHLRARWRATVAEVAGWMPQEWQGAVAWWAWLPDLPVIDALAHRRPLPASAVERAFADLAEAPPATTSPWAPIAPAWRGESDAAQAWVHEWRRRLPRRRDETLALLERAARRHLAAFRAAPPGSGAPLRASVAATLRLLYCRAITSPAAAFVFLAQWLLDGERLRGELARRAALPRVPLAA
jgi:hypothetical protein